LLAIVGCSPAIETPADYTVAVGQQLDVPLGRPGFGTYDTIPTISAPLVRFVAETDVGPYTPEGGILTFSFIVVKPGRVTLTFRRSDTSPATSKSVVVEVQ
jgi:hypothetical protein